MTRLALLLTVLATTHAFAPHRRAHASLLRAATADLDALSYRELQAACKAAKLPAKGAAAVLRERLRDAAPEDAAPMAVDVAVAAGAAVDVDAAVAADDDDAVFAALLGDADGVAAAPDDDDDDFFAALLAGGDDEDYVAAALATAADAAVDGVADARRALSAEARSGSASRIRAAWARFAAACDGSNEAPSEGDACLALRPYGASGACGEARTVLEDVERLGRNGTAREWHLALEAFSRAKRPADADRFLGAARLRGAFPARPDGRLYRQVLKHCVGAANWRRALHVLEDMEAQKVDDEDLSVDARDWNLGVFAAERLAVDGAKRAATRRGAKRAVKEGDAAAPGRILAAMAAHGHAPELKALGAAPDYRADGVVAALDAVKRAAAALDGDARASEATRDSYAAAAVAVLEQFARDDDGGEGPARRADSRGSDARR
ncbi:endonuclease [Aureococcus anophagefferens]|nr:endonuclease [Aureococcus anophagefferens]